MKKGAEQADVPAAEQSAEKLCYSIGEVSQMTGVEPYVLRYWESEFKLLHPSKRSSGQRSYQQKDIDAILTIKQLLYEDLYSIAGAKKRLREEKAGKPMQHKAEARQPDASAVELLKGIRSCLVGLKEEINKP